MAIAAGIGARMEAPTPWVDLAARLVDPGVDAIPLTGRVTWGAGSGKLVRVSYRLSPRTGDALLTLGVLSLTVVELLTEGLHPYAASVPLAIAQACTLYWRRQLPLAMLILANAALFVETAAGVSLHTPVSPTLEGPILIYSVAQYEQLPRAIAGLAFVLAGFLAEIQLAIANGESYDDTDRAFVTLLILAPWAVGRALAGRRREAVELSERAERLELERLTAVEEERGRIARELHDVIAHSLSVMVVLAGAGEEVVARAPERAVEPLRAIQETGRQALSEMSRLLGVLRQGGDEIGLVHQPGFADLPELAEQTRLAGLPVELVVDGDARPLAPGLDLSVYRIVQEALTNTRKHAGAARSTVRLAFGPDTLEIEATDNGRGATDAVTGGHGLIGIAERVAIFGGTLAAGPRDGGGFAVKVSLPLEAVGGASPPTR